MELYTYSSQDTDTNDWNNEANPSAAVVSWWDKGKEDLQLISKLLGLVISKSTFHGRVR